MSTAAHDFNRLSVSEGIQLVEDLWDSIAVGSADVPLIAGEIQELHRRLDDLEANPGASVPWDEVGTRVEERLRLCS